jgi:protein-disulfide isomerase
MRLVLRIKTILLVWLGSVMLMASDTPAALQTKLNRDISKIDSHEFVTGAQNAPVTLIAYVNFQCPFCQSFHTEILPRLRSRFINKGQLKIVYRILPMNADLASHAVVTSEVAECAAAQGRFWEMADLLYRHPGESAWDNFQKWSSEADITDKESFNRCFAFHETATQVLKNQHRYAIHDVKMTPTIIIGDSKTEGLRDYEDYEELILAQLD